MYPEDLYSPMTFIDTIRYEDGAFVDLPRHLARIQATALAHGGQLDIGAVERRLYYSAPMPQGLHRVTLYYNPLEVLEVRSILYQRREIQRLYLYELPEDFSYCYKYADRSFFLHARAELSPEEDLLFVRSDGSLTGTTYTNVLLELPNGTLITPSRPLLRGTQLSRLLEQGIAQEVEGLTGNDLRRSYRIHLINAMMPLGEAITLSPRQIID